MPSELLRSNKDLRKWPFQAAGPLQRHVRQGRMHALKRKNAARRFAFISQSFSPSADRTNSNGKPQQTKTQLCVDDALSALPIGPLIFSMRKTIRLSLRSVISTLSPVSRMKIGRASC